MEWISGKKIKLHKPVNELDKFVLRFIRILEKYVDYVIISGYVAILLGRSRATEDVDLFVKPLEKEKFLILYHQLKDAGFWCKKEAFPSAQKTNRCLFSCVSMQKVMMKYTVI